MVDVSDVDLAAEPFVVGRRDVVVKLDEVTFVIAQRVVRCVALVFQMLDEIINVFLHLMYPVHIATETTESTEVKTEPISVPSVVSVAIQGITLRAKSFNATSFSHTNSMRA